MPADPNYRFGGFRFPNYTQAPNEFFDELAPRLTEAELRVLIYVIRRTFGFHKNADAISLSQMTNGLKTTDGQTIDHGTGMSKSAVWRGTKGLVEKGVLNVDRLQNPDGEYETNVYSLRFAEETGVTLLESNPSSAKEPGVTLQERIQKIARKKDEKDPSNLRKIHTIEKYDDDRLALLPYAQDLAREMNDQAPLSSTTTRLVNIYKGSGLDLETFIDRLMQARAITQERTSSIRTQSDGIRSKPKMAFMLAVLEDLVGREAS
jgi:Bacteriophage replication protein O